MMPETFHEYHLAALRDEDKHRSDKFAIVTPDGHILPKTILEVGHAYRFLFRKRVLTDHGEVAYIEGTLQTDPDNIALLENICIGYHDGTKEIHPGTAASLILIPGTRILDVRSDRTVAYIQQKSR
jgi:hypothetical protein